MPLPHPEQQPSSDSNAAAYLSLTVVIPAYNESQRLPPYLEAMRRYTDLHYANELVALIRAQVA